MIRKFDQLNWHVRIFEGVDVSSNERAPTPDQIQQALAHNRWDPHAWSVMQGHMTMLETYVQESTAPYVMCMEDDILIRSDINDHLPKIVLDFELCKLDLLMLGYLIHEPMCVMSHEHAVLNQVFTFHEYPFNIYGTQMYMMTRSHAEWLVQSYGYHTQWQTQVLSTSDSYNADWVITKQGKRACVYPLLAIEQSGGGQAYADQDQTHFHQLCHAANYPLTTYL